MKSRSLLLLASALFASTASAQTFTTSGSFFGAAGSPLYTETFESVPVAKDIQHASFSQAGITYTGQAGSPFPNVWVASPGYTNFGAGLNPTTTSILTANGDEDFLISFLTPYYSVGFDVYYNGLGPTTASFFNGSTLLGSIFYNGSAFKGFNGFVSTPSALITSVHFVSTAGGQLNTGIDNLSVGAAPSTTVPEPASVALLTLGLVSVGAARRRQKSRLVVLITSTNVVR